MNVSLRFFVLFIIAVLLASALLHYFLAQMGLEQVFFGFD
jgi:hypothetical protein